MTDDARGDRTVLVGCDVGGTFTDAIAVDAASGQEARAKVPTTPDDQSDGVSRAVQQALGRLGAGPEHVVRVLHGTTTATNALLEGRLARLALVTNEGMEDLIEIRRQDRPRLYDLTVTRPAALVDRGLRFGVAGRLGPDGSQLVPLDLQAVRDAAKRIAASDAEAVAVCMLHAYASGEHEARASAILEGALGEHVPVDASHVVSPEFREVERFTTTLVNAGLRPRMERYLDRLETRLHDLGVDAPVAVLDSAGALLSTREAARLPVRTVLSGPAGGAAACAWYAQAHREPDLLGVDMGGTSTDVTLVVAGKPTESWASELAGHALQVPTADIHTVGAGGGSIAHVDDAGGLRVGPTSAGARPGPACYGRGGTAPTVTDACVVLGWVPAQARLGGSVELDGAAALAAVEEVAARLGDDVHDTAAAIVRIAAAHAVRGIRVLTARHAVDPTGLTLVAFGGAGPLFGTVLAEELGASRVLVPSGAGVASAMGLLAAPPRVERSRTVMVRLGHDEPAVLEAAFDELTLAVVERLGEPAARVVRLVSARYHGQAHELTVEVPAKADDGRVRSIFERAHEARFGYRLDEAPVEVVAVRVRAELAGAWRDATDGPEEGGSPAQARAEGTVPLGTLAAPGRSLQAARFVHEELAPGSTFRGPAVVLAEDATTVVAPGWRATVLGDRSLLLDHVGGDP